MLGIQFFALISDDWFKIDHFNRWLIKKNYIVVDFCLAFLGCGLIPAYSSIFKLRYIRKYLTYKNDEWREKENYPQNCYNFDMLKWEKYKKKLCRVKLTINL